MNTFTTPQNAQIINITGNVKIALIDNQILQNGDFIKAGDQLILAKGSEIVLAFADGTQQTLYGGPGEIAPATDSEIDAILAGEAPPDTAPPTDALDDIAAIQALIEAGDEEIDLPATAAGGDTGNEGLGFITLERSGAETLAESGFDTTGLDPAAALAGEDPALNTELDAIPPTLTITSSAPNSDQNDQSLITFEFSEDVTGFTETDVNVNIGTLTGFTQIDGDTWTAIFTPEPATDLTAVISVADDTYTDLAGNSGSGDSIDIISLDAPTLTASDTATVNEDSPATGNVLDNDSDADDELTVATFTVAGDTTIYQNGETVPVEGGSLSIFEDGSYNFTPADDWNGTLPVITYTTNTGASDTLTITVEPINDPPVALDDTASGNEGDTITILAGGAISVLANDTDVDGNPLTVTSFTQPGNGTVTVNSDGTFSYVHNGGESTSDSFTYTVSDGQGGTDTATVNLSIAAVNDAPDAVNDAGSGNEGGTITILTGGAISVLANDTDVDGNPLTVTSFTQPGNGSVTVNSDGTFSYVHNGGETTSDSFTYTVSDGQGGTDTATVNLSIAAVNDAPDAVNDAGSGNEGGTITVLTGGAISVLANDTDAEGNPLTVTSFTQPSNGSVEVNEDGTFSYVHNDSKTTSDSFTYTVSDGQGGTDTATVNLSIALVDEPPPPPPPIVDNPSVLAADSQTINEDTVATGNVLTNDFDSDDILSVVSFEFDDTTHPADSLIDITEGENNTVIGTLTMASNGDYIFTPIENWSGFVPTIGYTTNTGFSSTLDITVNPIADPLLSLDAAVGELTEIKVDTDDDPGQYVTPDGNPSDEPTNEFVYADGTIISTGVDGSGNPVNLYVSNGQGIGVGDNGDFRISDGDGLTVEFIGAVTAIDLTFKNALDEEIDIVFHHVDGSESTLPWSSGATNNALHTTTITPPPPSENIPFSSFTLIDHDPTGENGLTLMAMETTTGEVTFVYPLTAEYELIDTDGSESVIGVTLAGFPDGTIIIEGDGDDIIEITDNGDGTWTVEPTAFTKEPESDLYTLNDLFITTTSILDDGFEPRIEVVVEDRLGDVISTSISINGGSESSVVEGGDGNDFLNGQSGEDMLIGGAGDDTLTGGADADIFKWLSGDDTGTGMPPTDHVTDFDVNQGDKLDLSELLTGENSGNLDEYLNFTVDDDGNTIIDIDVDGTANGSDITQVIVLDGLDLEAEYGQNEGDIIEGLLADGALLITEEFAPLGAPIQPELDEVFV